MLQCHGLCRRRPINGGIYCFQHAVHICGEIVVPESQHAITLSFKPSGARFVSLATIVTVMLGTINFNDEASSHAGEISDIGSNRHLTPKMGA
jgi:hypothetical protein